MENNYKVNVFPSANNDLFSIADYWQIFLEVSPKPFIDDYERAIISLSESPLIHHLSNDPTLREKGYRIFPIRNYYIFYVVLEEKKEVQIHRILYNKMDFTKIL